MLIRRLAVAVTVAAVPSFALADDKCVTKEEAQAIGIYLTADSVRDGLDICLKNFPELNDQPFGQGARDNLEKAAPQLEKAEAMSRAAFDKAYGEQGARRLELLRDGALGAGRKTLAAFGKVECTASVVGYAKIAEVLAQRAFEDPEFSAESLSGEIPMCPK